MGSMPFHLPNKMGRVGFPSFCGDWPKRPWKKRDLHLSWDRMGKVPTPTTTTNVPITMGRRIAMLAGAAPTTVDDATRLGTTARETNDASYHPRHWTLGTRALKSTEESNDRRK